jgi:anthranilate phosphoribosyltransferase
MKGETTQELIGFARAMREAVTPVSCQSDDLIDTCGTGGDLSHSFNVSTAAAFVVAGAGGRVAKHGNRSVSSRCGSADVLEALGARLEMAPEQSAQAIDRIGFGFLFAPQLHAAMRHAVQPRRALGVRTVFNQLGPLSNPAGAPHQLLGVYDRSLLMRFAEVLQQLGTKRALLVHGDDGMDELTVCADNDMVLVEPDGIQHLRLSPQALGLGPHPSAALRGGDAAANAQMLRGILERGAGPGRDIVLLNAAAALWAGGRVASLADGVEAARVSIDSLAARQKLEDYVRFSHGPV